MTLTKRAIVRQKLNDKVLMSTAETTKLFGKIWIPQKQDLPMVHTFH
jgi:hypothetical protein